MFHGVKMDDEKFAFCETVADMAMNMQTARMKNELKGDSRELVAMSIAWAEEFEELHKGHQWDGEYFDEVDSFFALKFKEQFGYSPFGKETVKR
jgi:hypothetical protein